MQQEYDYKTEQNQIYFIAVQQLSIFTSVQSIHR